eukprot:366944_1
MGTDGQYTIYSIACIAFLMLVHSLFTGYYSKLALIMFVTMFIFYVICIIGLFMPGRHEWHYYSLLYWYPFAYIMLSWVLLFYSSNNKKIQVIWVSILVIAISIFDYITDVNIIIVLFQQHQSTYVIYGIIQICILIIGNLFCVIFVSDFYHSGLERREKLIARIWSIVGLGRIWYSVLSWDSYKNYSMDYAAKSLKVWEMLIESFPSVVLQLSLTMTLEKHFSAGLYLSIAVTMLSVAFTVFKILLLDNRAQEKAKGYMEENMRVLSNDNKQNNPLQQPLIERNESIVKVEFQNRPFYFDTDYGNYYLNAYIDNIKNKELNLQFKTNYFIHKIGDIITDNMNYENINNFLRTQSLPFTMEFTPNPPQIPVGLHLWQVFILFYDTKQLPFTLTPYTNNRNATVLIKINNSSVDYDNCVKHGLKNNLYVYKINGIVVENMMFECIQLILKEMAKHPPLKIVFSKRKPLKMMSLPYLKLFDKTNTLKKCEILEETDNITIIAINVKDDIHKFGFKSGKLDINAILSDVDMDFDDYVGEEKQWRSIKDLYIHSINHIMVDNLKYNIIEKIFINETIPLILRLKPNAPVVIDDDDDVKYDINNHDDDKYKIDVIQQSLSKSNIRFYFVFYIFILSDFYIRTVPFLILFIIFNSFEEKTMIAWSYLSVIVFLATFEGFWYEWMLSPEYKYKLIRIEDNNYKKVNIRLILKFFWSSIFTVSYHLLSTLKLSYIPKSVILTRLIQQHVTRMVVQTLVTVTDLFLIPQQHMTLLIAYFIMVTINICCLFSIFPTLVSYQQKRQNKLKPKQKMDKNEKKIEEEKKKKKGKKD